MLGGPSIVFPRKAVADESFIRKSSNLCKSIFVIDASQLLQVIIDGRLFGYVQCDIEVPEHLRDYFSNFPPIFKNFVVSRGDIGYLMKQYAKMNLLWFSLEEC